jgi:FMN phosphatase YigB (HAD superfamily)
MRAPPLQALLFDLGGVLVDIDFNRALVAWSQYSALPLAILKQAFSFDEQYERHERGEIPSSAYFAHLASALQLSATLEEIDSGWNSIFVGEIVATRKLVESARRSLPCYAFTNTNASHMACWSKLFPSVVAAFDKIFASHEIGLRKPERAAFDHICSVIGADAQSVMFFDDVSENVQAATDAGLRSVLVRGPADVANALRAVSCEA